MNKLNLPGSTILTAAKNSYKKNPQSLPNNYKLIIDTDTFDVYINESEKSIIITLRGTKTATDVLADLKLPFNKLKKSVRFVRDNEKLKKLINIYPPQVYKYFLIGHSLAGGIINQMKRMYPFIQGATFNSASQPMDIIQQDKIRDIVKYFINKDLLYQTAGRFYKDAKVFKYNPKRVDGFFNKFKNLFTSVPLQAHKLEQFDRYV